VSAALRNLRNLRLIPPRSSSVFICVHLWLTPLLCICGCGYSSVGGEPRAGSGYQWRSLYREDVKTVAVPIFQNKSFRRGVEFQLTQALVQQIEAKSPYKVVPKERADTVLDGEIIERQSTRRVVCRKPNAEQSRNRR